MLVAQGGPGQLDPDSSQLAAGDGFNCDHHGRPIRDIACATSSGVPDEVVDAVPQAPTTNMVTSNTKQESPTSLHPTNLIVRS